MSLEIHENSFSCPTYSPHAISYVKSFSNISKLEVLMETISRDGKKGFSNMHGVISALTNPALESNSDAIGFMLIRYVDIHCLVLYLMSFSMFTVIISKLRKFGRI